MVQWTGLSSPFWSPLTDMDVYHHSDSFMKLVELLVNLEIVLLVRPISALIYPQVVSCMSWIKKTLKIWDYLIVKFFLPTSVEFSESVVYDIYSAHRLVYIHVLNPCYGDNCHLLSIESIKGLLCLFSILYHIFLNKVIRLQSCKL